MSQNSVVGGGGVVHERKIAVDAKNKNQRFKLELHQGLPHGKWVFYHRATPVPETASGVISGEKSRYQRY